MQYQMMVLTNSVKDKSYCTGNTQFLQATSKQGLVSIIVDSAVHCDNTSIFNQKFRSLFNTNARPDELDFIIFGGADEKIARAYAVGRVCNNLTRAQGNRTKQCSPITTLEPLIIEVNIKKAI